MIPKPTGPTGITSWSWVPMSDELLSGFAPKEPRRTPEDVAAYLERYKQDAAQRRERVDGEHAAVLVGADGLRREILTLHGPSWGYSGNASYPECDGCQWGGYEAEPPEFPCSTYKLARDFGSGGLA